MHPELRRGISERRQRGDRGDFSIAQAEVRAAVNVAERKLDHVSREVRSDVGE
ncbi:hypothetical protein ACVWXM_008434 [Bradyrhizobium sp. GM7.3]